MTISDYALEQEVKQLRARNKFLANSFDNMAALVKDQRELIMALREENELLRGEKE